MKSLHICRRGCVIQPKHFTYLVIEHDDQGQRKLFETDNEDFIRELAKEYKKVYGLAFLKTR